MHSCAIVYANPIDWIEYALDGPAAHYYSYANPVGKNLVWPKCNNLISVLKLNIISYGIVFGIAPVGITNMITSIAPGSSSRTLSITTAPIRTSITITLTSSSSLITISPSTLTFNQGDVPSQSVTFTAAPTIDSGSAWINISISGNDAIGYYAQPSSYVFTTVAVRKYCIDV
jgi:hypothetical protein